MCVTPFGGIPRAHITAGGRRTGKTSMNELAVNSLGDVITFGVNLTILLPPCNSEINDWE